MNTTTTHTKNRRTGTIYRIPCLLVILVLAIGMMVAGCGDNGPTGPKEPTVLKNKIVFTKEVYHPESETNPYAYELHLMNPDGSGESTLKDSPFREEFFPDISPDGTKIVLMVTAPDPNDYHGDIAIVNADGTGFHKLTSGENDASSAMVAGRFSHCILR